MPSRRYDRFSNESFSRGTPINGQIIWSEAQGAAFIWVNGEWKSLDKLRDENRNLAGRYGQYSSRSCSCHVSPPCSFCVSLSEDEAEAFANGGFDNLTFHWRTVYANNNQYIHLLEEADRLELQRRAIKADLEMAKELNLPVETHHASLRLRALQIKDENRARALEDVIHDFEEV